MKVVTASTDEQVEKLQELIQYIYSYIFPQFFSEEEIEEYLSLEVLHIPEDPDSELYRLDMAFQAIASLAVIIAILESLPNSYMSDYRFLFRKNAKILEELGLFFPFTLETFMKKEQPCNFERNLYFNKLASSFIH